MKLKVQADVDDIRYAVMLREEVQANSIRKRTDEIMDKFAPGKAQGWRLEDADDTR